MVFYTFLSALVLLLLYFIGIKDFLLFYGITGIFGVVIAFAIFFFTWNSRDLMQGGFFLIIGIAYMFIGGLEFLHVASYIDFGGHYGNEADLPLQLWAITRYLEAASFIVAAVFIRSKVNLFFTFSIYALLTGTMLASVYIWNIFPSCIDQQQEFTSFKIISEYVICFLFAASFALLYKKRFLFSKKVLLLILTSILFSIASEILLTLYADPNGFFNIFSHILKVASFYLIYRAVIVTGLRDPYAILLRDLKESEASLRLANKDLQGFAQTVSHDIRSPISNIISACELSEILIQEISDKNDCESIRKVLKIIENSARSSHSLVTDILNFSSASNKTSGTFVNINVKDEVVRAVKDMEESIIRKRVKIIIDEELGVIPSSPSHVYQLFSNLIKNCIIHCKAENPVIEVQLKEIGKNGILRYIVRDNGKGIPAEYINSIFEPFFKGESGGSGLGLAIVQRIVHVYDGEIMAYNDSGACFEFTLCKKLAKL